MSAFNLLPPARLLLRRLPLALKFAFPLGLLSITALVKDAAPRRSAQPATASTGRRRVARKRLIAWLCNWQTRDWLTSSTAPISRRLSSSS